PTGVCRARGGLLLVSPRPTALTLSTLGWAANVESEAHGAAAGHDHGAPLDDFGIVAAGGGHDHDHGDAAGPCKPTGTQLAAAGRLLDDTRHAVVRFDSLPAALAAGYRPHTPNPE